MRKTLTAEEVGEILKLTRTSLTVKAKSGEIPGMKIGNRLRKEQRETTHRKDSVRPHIRRAHWHGFWSGPMTGERKFEIK